MKKKHIGAFIIVFIGLFAGIVTISTGLNKFLEIMRSIFTNSIVIAVLVSLVILIVLSFLTALWAKLLERHFPKFSKIKVVDEDKEGNSKVFPAINEINESLKGVKKSLVEFREENLSKCRIICNSYSTSLEDIKKYNRIAGKVKDLVFHLALQGHEFSYDITKGEDDENNKNYIAELNRLEGNEKLGEGDTPIDKKVYVITNDMSLDIYSEQFNKVVKMNNMSSFLKKYNTIYKYIIPRGMMVEVPEEMESRVRAVIKKHNIGKINKNGWPKLTLPDIYRFKYFDEIYEEEENQFMKNEKFIKWTKKRSEIFLEVEPEIFNIFGPSPERTIYFHQLGSGTAEGKIIVSLFLKSEKHFPSSGKKFRELDMLTIDLDEEHSVVQEIEDMIKDFETIWDKMKNINFDYPILDVMDVPFLLEEEAKQIWVLTPDLVFDNTFVPIRTLVKKRLEVCFGPGDSEKFKYRFIIPYNPGDRRIVKHLKVFFRSHNISSEEEINKVLRGAFIFVSSNVLAKFSIFGEISLYRNVTGNEGEAPKNILCFFPPVSSFLFGGFNTRSKTEIDTEELLKEFGDDAFVKYADFAVILNEKFTKTFLEHMETIIDEAPETIEGEPITYYNCTYNKKKDRFEISSNKSKK
jgi:hypothetical protein